MEKSVGVQVPPAAPFIILHLNVLDVVLNVIMGLMVRQNAI